MSQLFRVLYANKCTSTHHKLAMDALLQLETVHAGAWQNLFIKNIELYLDGAKAPDKKFKDFRNHVLHVQDNYWGGAVALQKPQCTQLRRISSACMPAAVDNKACGRDVCMFTVPGTSVPG